MTADLLDIVRGTVKLTRKGREYTGLCPFHNEKTPSFYVVPDKGFFHCFGCGAHGDAVGFVMRDRNLGYREALAALNGGTLPALDPAVRAARQAEQRREAYRRRILAAYEDRNPHACPEEIKFLRGHDDARLVAWAGRP